MTQVFSGLFAAGMAIFRKNLVFLFVVRAVSRAECASGMGKTLEKTRIIQSSSVEPLFSTVFSTVVEILGEKPKVSRTKPATRRSRTRDCSISKTEIPMGKSGVRIRAANLPLSAFGIGVLGFVQ